jgi:fluoride exporter
VSVQLPIDPDEAEPAKSAAPDGSNDRPFTQGRRTAVLPPWRILAVIALGGFFGGLSRYGLGLAFPAQHGAFPTATFAINVSGSFVLALLIVFVLEVWPPTTYIRPLIGVGFCGAYTTFSTWMVGVDQLISDGKSATAVWYLFGSLVAGLAATSLGLTSGRAVVAHRRRTRAPGAEAETGAGPVARGSLETAEEGQA